MFSRLAIALLFFFVCVDADAANRFLTCNTACTITASDTTIWGTTTGGTGASVPGSSDAVVLDGATCVGGTTCTATMGAGYNPTWQSITMGACTASTTGCIFDWSVNNNNITLTANTGFNGSGTGTRSLKMGSGTLTLSATASGITLWAMSTTTNLTFNAGTSIIDYSGVMASGSQTFAGGSLTYSTVRVSGARLNGGLVITSASILGNLTNTAATSISITVAATITTLTQSAQLILSLPAGATTTITNAPTLTGTATAPLAILSNASGAGQSVATVNTGSGTFSGTWCSIQGIAFTGGATFSFTSSADLGHNTGVTITAPQTGGGGIIGGTLLKRDLLHNNDNTPMFLNKAA